MSAIITLSKIWRYDGGFTKTYRIVGEPTSHNWRIAAKFKPAWCEFTIYNDGDQLSSYGGEVWPSAWPELFTALPSSVQGGSGRIKITDACRVLLVTAEDIANGAAPALRTNQTIRELGGQS